MCRTFALPLCGTLIEGAQRERGYWISPGEACPRLGPEQGTEEDEIKTWLAIVRSWREEYRKWVHLDS